MTEVYANAVQDAAADYRERGLSPIPLRMRSKEPKLPKGHPFLGRPATGGEFAKFDFRHNIGLVTGKVSGIIVLDDDDGGETLRKNGWHVPATPMVKTKRGHQYYFRCPEAGFPTFDVTGKLEVRGDGAYVAAPPSIHPSGERYEWVISLDDADFADAPEWLIAQGARPGDRRKPIDTGAVLDGVPEGERDKTLFRASAKLRGAGVPYPFARKLVLEAAANCTPPFSERSAIAKVDSAYRRYDPNDDDDIHSFNGKGTPIKEKNLFLTPREIVAAAQETTPWICEPWVARGGVTDVAGAAKLAGKTTFAMCMTKAILEGGYFMGRKAMKAPVVLLTEQGSNIAKAFRDAGISEETDGLHIMPRRLTLDMKWSEIAKTAVAKCLESGAKVLVVDTLPRFAGLEGDKENNAGDVMKAMTPLVDAAQVHDLAVWSIRHANHEGRGRGSTAFLHDVDIVVTMRLPDATLPANVRVVEAHGRYDGIPAKTNIEFRDGLYYDLGADSKVQYKRAREAVVDTLASGREVPSPELMDRAAKAAGTSTATVNTAIGDLVDEGEISRLGRGVKGDPYRYILSFNRGGAREKRKKEEAIRKLVREGMSERLAREGVLGKAWVEP